MATALAFVRRDAFSWLSYRTSVFWHFLSIGITLAIAYLGWQALGETGAGLVGGYNQNYVGFVLTGIILVELWSLAYVLPDALRGAQGMGTLEAMMLSHWGLYRLLLYSGIFPAMLKLSRTLALALFAIFVMGLWHDANVPALVVALAVSFAPMICVGVLCVAAVLAIKQLDPFLGVYAMLNGLLAGVYFPRALIPDWAAPLSYLLPLTHAIEATRRALSGASVAEILPQLVVLTGMFIVLFPLALWAVNWGLARAREEGSLVQY